jgi:NarL family two-component system response regulator LiaR
MQKAEVIRVLIADDHGMVRKGLVSYLKNKHDLEVVGEACNGKEAIAQCEQLHPDVVLMDLIMPELGGVAATHTIHKNWPDIQVLALTSFQDRELVQDALQAGAISYLLKNISGDDLADAIRAAYAGRPTLSPEAVQSLIRRDETDPVGRDLTRREQEVLEWMVKGLKLGVSNRAEAISVAIQHKLVRRQ